MTHSPVQLLKPTEDPTIFDIEFDNSTLELFTTCARRAEMYTVKRREPARTGAALFFGSTAHDALQIRMLHQVQPLHRDWEQEQINAVIAAYTTNPSAFEEWRTPDQLIKIIQAYNKRWPIQDEPFTVISDKDGPMIERSFRLLLGTAEMDTTFQTPLGATYVKKFNIYYTGRMDAVIEMFAQPFVMDHKTASVTGASYYTDFELSSQMLGYVWACRELGIPAVGLLADVLECRAPSKTGKEINFVRQPYWYTDFHISEWKADVEALIADFLEHWARAYFPKSTKWCHGKYGECPYWQVCTRGSQEERESLLSNNDYYKNVEWSPLNKV